MELRQALMIAPVLTLANYDHKFALYTNASSTDIRPMLAQKNRATGYASTTLSSAERNYAITESELFNRDLGPPEVMSLFYGEIRPRNY